MRPDRDECVGLPDTSELHKQQETRNSTRKASNRQKVPGQSEATGSVEPSKRLSDRNSRQSLESRCAICAPLRLALVAHWADLVVVLFIPIVRGRFEASTRQRVTVAGGRFMSTS